MFPPTFIVEVELPLIFPLAVMCPVNVCVSSTELPNVEFPIV